MGTALGVFGVALVAGLVAVVWVWRDRKAIGLKAAYRLVEAGLPNDRDLVAVAATRFEQRQLVSTIGGAIGGALGLGVVMYVGAALPGLIWSALISTFGVGFAICWMHFKTVGDARKAGPRTASLRPRRLTDFLVWPEVVVQYGALVLPLAAVWLGVMVAAGDDRPSRGWALLGAAAVALAIYVTALALQARVLRLSQAATGEPELRWEEAMRAATLRELSEVMTWSCWFLGAGAAISFEYPRSVPSFVEPIMLALFAVGVVVMGVAQVSGSTKWGLRRSQRAFG
ncbi:hypothetical protein [Kribbella sp. DT2]|uniref:hypothetical protein n=1 Tax=Kribbella sp. DT2 TaxID=3393427 RepID=UPI003CEEEB39